MSDAKALLLVDHHQPQGPERDVLREQAVRADDDIDGAVHQPQNDVVLLARAAKAREHLDVQRKGAQAVSEGVIVLLGQNGGGHQHGHLLAVHHRLEGGAQRHLSLAIAHIAAHQAAHRFGALHVGLDLGQRAELVVGLLVGE